MPQDSINVPDPTEGKSTYELMAEASTEQAPRLMNQAGLRMETPSPDQTVKALGPIQLTIGALGRSIDRLEDQVINLASNLAPVLKPAVPTEAVTPFARDLDETLPEIGQMVLDQVDRSERLHWIVSDLLDRLGV